jgi:hypothetical protein
MVAKCEALSRVRGFLCCADMRSPFPQRLRRADHSQFVSPLMKKSEGEQSADRRWCGTPHPVVRLASGPISGSPEITGP